MHYTGMAAVQAHAAPGLVVNTAETASATAFLLPLILGLSGVGFIFSAIIALSPTAAEIVEEGELMKRIGQSQAAQVRAGQARAQGWRPPRPQPDQPYQAARDEPGRTAGQPVPPAAGSLSRGGRQRHRGDLTVRTLTGARSKEAGSFGRMTRRGPWPRHLPAMVRPAIAATRSAPCSGAA